MSNVAKTELEDALYADDNAFPTVYEDFGLTPRGEAAINMYYMCISCS